MQKIITLTLGFIILLFNLSCSHQSRSWSSGMQGMAKAYTRLLPYIYDSERFRDPKNEKFINLYLRQLNENAGSLNKHTGRGLSGDDPLFAVGLKGLKSTLKKTSESYFAESYDYSQKLLQKSLNYCNSCHTRTSLGPTFITWDQFEKLPAQPKPLDKAKMLVATRQFPSAVETLEHSIQRDDLNSSARLNTLKLAIFISIKNLESPQKAFSIIKDLDTKSFSKTMKNKILVWKKYLNNWPQSKVTVKEIKKNYLVQKKTRQAQHFISNIHETMSLHKYLSLEVDKNWRARAYHRLGEVYGQNPDLGFWELPDAYYETCIYELPGSKVALKCYYSLEKMLFSQSSGVQSQALQRIDKYRLSKLKVLATPADNRPSAGAGATGSEDW